MPLSFGSRCPSRDLEEWGTTLPPRVFVTIYETTKTYTFVNTAVRTLNFTRYAHTYFSVTKCENSLYVFPHHSIAPGYCVGCLQIYAALPPPCGLFCDHLAAAESPSLLSVHLFHCWQLCTLYQIDLDLYTNRRKVMSFSLHHRPTADIINCLITFSLNIHYFHTINQLSTLC